MGLTVSSKTAKKLTFRRKNWKFQSLVFIKKNSRKNFSLNCNRKNLTFRKNCNHQP